METHKFNVGDKVMISLDCPDYKHQGFDGDKRMTGVITHVSSGMLSYTVNWENGNAYCYASIHLVLADPYVGKTVLTDKGEGVVIKRVSDSREGDTRYFINIPLAEGVVKTSHCETYKLPETCIGMHGKILRICDFKIVTSQPLSTEPVTGEQTTTKTKTLNYNKNENTSKSSGSIKVCNSNFKISEGVGTRGFGLKSSGSKIKLGNNNRNN